MNEIDSLNDQIKKKESEINELNNDKIQLIKNLKIMKIL